MEEYTVCVTIFGLSQKAGFIRNLIKFNLNVLKIHTVSYECNDTPKSVLRYGKPVLRYVLRYTWYLYFCLLLPLVQYYNIIQSS